ncbi:MAG: RIO1 family regulatory kinase/ATPase [Candidatus Thorarchaeota archaeon]
MSRIEKHNPLKSSALSRQESIMRDGKCGKIQFKELTLEQVKKSAVEFGLVTDVVYQLNAGKEASIYLAMWNEHPIILKAYRLWSSPHKLSTQHGYITTGGKRTYLVTAMMEEIAVKEFDILTWCFKGGVHVPTPIGRVGHFLTMRFIGDGLDPAPQLKDVELENPELALDQILDDYLLMYSKVHYTHGDLSAYNILWWQERPWIIDIPQGDQVNKWANMKKVELVLKRDIRNVLNYFEQYGIYKDEEYILNVFLDEYIPYNLRHYRELDRGGELL